MTFSGSRGDESFRAASREFFLTSAGGTWSAASLMGSLGTRADKAESLERSEKVRNRMVQHTRSHTYRRLRYLPRPIRRPSPPH